MLRYRRRPGTIEAIQWSGLPEDYTHVANLVGTGNITDSGSLYSEADRTWHQLVPGDWIARDDLGLYLIRGSRFVENYEPYFQMAVENPNQLPLWESGGTEGIDYGQDRAQEGVEDDLRSL